MNKSYQQATLHYVTTWYYTTHSCTEIQNSYEQIILSNAQSTTTWTTQHNTQQTIVNTWRKNTNVQVKTNTTSMQEKSGNVRNKWTTVYSSLAHRMYTQKMKMQK